MNTTENYENDKIKTLCSSVRSLCEDGKFEECCGQIYEAMSEFPHAVEPHNLLGIVLEKMGDHGLAMKHFRAAWTLDPTYRPASTNLHNFGTFYSNGRCAYDESDLESEANHDFEIIYDEGGVGHVVRKNKIEHDKHGVGYVVRRND